MSRQKTITTEYLESMSGLTLEEQAVLLAHIAQSDDEGRGLAHPEVIRQNNPQLAANMSACDIAAVQESFLEGKWKPYVWYKVGDIEYYALADYKQFCTRNHPAPSKLPAPPAELLPVLPQPAPSRGRPPKDESAKGAAKSRAKCKAAPAPKEKWTAPKHPESTYQEFRSIFNEVLGPHVGKANDITPNAHRNIDLSIDAGYSTQDFRRACEIGAQSDWFCHRIPGKEKPTNLETTCPPKTITGLLEGRYNRKPKQKN